MLVSGSTFKLSIKFYINSFVYILNYIYFVNMYYCNIREIGNTQLSYSNTLKPRLWMEKYQANKHKIDKYKIYASQGLSSNKLFL